MIKAKVIKMDKKKAILDTGVGKLANIGVHELTEDSVLERGEEWKNSSSSGSAVSVGDIVQVFLESVETPEGDMLVTGQESAVQRRTKAVWAELLERLKDGKPVKGRLLNSLAGGYSVGVAGIVCFLPNRNASKITVSKIGELADYRVIQMNASRSNVVLEDCRLQKRRSQGGGKSSSRRPSPRQGELLRY
jgi:ribosomal protein S1